MGFQLDLSQSSSDHDGKLQTYSVAAAHSTLLAPGDVVRLTGTSDVNGVASVDAAAAAQSVSGVVAGVVPQFEGENLNETGLPALTAGKVMVHIDPNLTFLVPVANGPLVANDVGLNAPIVATAATKSGGLTVSNMTLNATGKAVTATLAFRIIGLPVDDAGALDGTRAFVRFNNSTIRAGAAGV